MKNELELEAQKMEVIPKPKVLGFVTIISKCKKGTMRLMEGSIEIENLLSNGWKIKKGK